MEPPDRDAFDHRLVTNRAAAPAAAWVRAENALVDTLLDRGLTAYLTVDRALLTRGAGSSAAAAAARSLASVDDTGVSEPQPVLAAGPGDRPLLRTLLAVDGPKVPEWRERGVERIGVVDGEEWRYYSRPRQPTVRFADGLEPRTRQAVRDAIADVPCTALVPQGVVADWLVEDVRVELTFEGLRLARADGGSHWYDHDDLEGVVVDPAATEVVLTWPTRRDRASTAVGRLAAGLLDRVRESPPRFLCPPDAATVETVARTYEILSERLCHGFTFRRQPGTVARF